MVGSTDSADSARGRGSGEHGDDAAARTGPDRGAGMIGVVEAQEIADRMRRLAGSIARQQAQFLRLLDEIDRSEAWTHWIGVRTLVQWVSFVCEMDPHTAREHVRVMRGLREMPQVAALLAEGRISFSKAREITRLSGRIDDGEAAEITTRATASQISSMVAAYRRLDSGDPEELLEALVGRTPEDIAEVRVPSDGTAEAPAGTGADVTVRLPRHLEQDSLHVSTQQYGRVRIILDLPEADAIELLAVVDAVRDSLNCTGEPEESGSPGGPGELEGASEFGELREPGTGGVGQDGPGQGAASRGGAGEQKAGAVRPEDRATRVDALLEVVRAHRDDVARRGRGRAARATVLVHVSPEALAAGNGGDTPVSSTARSDAQRCHTADRGPVTAASAARLACGGELIGALIDASGDVLALGRSRRLASHRQRIALSARDLHCQFPDCTRRHGLEAHHIRMWSEGGPTDMENMLLLCRSHHIAVHENRLRITRAADRRFTGALRGGTGFDFHTEEGVLIRAGAAGSATTADDTTEAGGASEGPATDDEPEASVTRPVLLDLPGARLGPREPDIVTIGGGWGFTLDAGVTWLFDAEAILRERRTDTPAQSSP